MPSTDQPPRAAEVTPRPVGDVVVASATQLATTDHDASARPDTSATPGGAPRATSAGDDAEVPADVAARRELVARERARDERQTERATTRRNTWTGLEGSYAMSLELMAALATWAGIGWLVDRWLGTGPWFLAIGALLGNAAGIYLIYLRSSRMEGFDGLPRPSAFAARHGARGTDDGGGRP